MSGTGDSLDMAQVPPRHHVGNLAGRFGDVGGYADVVMDLKLVPRHSDGVAATLIVEAERDAAPDGLLEVDLAPDELRALTDGSATIIDHLPE